MPAAIIPESHRDLLAAPVGVLSTIGPDGFPQATAIWFLAEEDGSVLFSLTHSEPRGRAQSRRTRR